MTEEEVRAFALNNGVNATPVGTPLRVLDPTQLPASVRKFVADDGTYKGGNTPEKKDARHEQSKGEADADDTAVRKMPMDSKEDVERREAEIEEGGKGLKGKLPDDFPHRKELEAAGITSYGRVRALAGDYSSVPGIGPAKGAEIDAALSE